MLTIVLPFLVIVILDSATSFKLLPPLYECHPSSFLLYIYFSSYYLYYPLILQISYL